MISSLAAFSRRSYCASPDAASVERRIARKALGQRASALVIIVMFLTGLSTPALGAQSRQTTPPPPGPSRQPSQPSAGQLPGAPPIVGTTTPPPVDTTRAKVTVDEAQLRRVLAPFLSTGTWEKINIGLSGAGMFAALATLMLTYFAQIWNTNRVKVLEFKLQFVERQLSELYGPLHGLLCEQEQAYAQTLLLLDLPTGILDSLKVYQLTRGRAGSAKHIARAATYFDPYGMLTESVPDPMRKSWLGVCRAQFLPRNRRIAELLSQKAHLISPTRDDHPGCFERLLEHIVQFEIRLAAYERDGARLSTTSSGVPWPPELALIVERKYHLLLALQNKYRTQIESVSIWQLFTGWIARRKWERLGVWRLHRSIRKVERAEARGRRPSQLQRVILLSQRARLAKLALRRDLRRHRHSAVQGAFRPMYDGKRRLSGESKVAAQLQSVAQERVIPPSA